MVSLAEFHFIFFQGGTRPESDIFSGIVKDVGLVELADDSVVVVGFEGEGIVAGAGEMGWHDVNTTGVFVLVGPESVAFSVANASGRASFELKTKFAGKGAVGAVFGFVFCAVFGLVTTEFDNWERLTKDF